MSQDSERAHNSEHSVQHTLFNTVTTYTSQDPYYNPQHIPLNIDTENIDTTHTSYNRAHTILCTHIVYITQQIAFSQHTTQLIACMFIYTIHFIHKYDKHNTDTYDGHTTKSI